MCWIFFGFLKCRLQEQRYVEAERKRLKIKSSVPVNLGDSVITGNVVLALLILDEATRKVNVIILIALT